MTLQDFALIAPMAILTLTASAVLLLTVAGGPKRPAPASGGHLSMISVAGFLMAMYSLYAQSDSTASAFSGAVVLDGLSVIFGLITLMGGLVGCLLASGYLDEHELSQGEFLALVQFATVGMLILIMAGDLMTLFVGLELMSLAVYVLAGYRRASRRAQEAALKYFVYGAFASGFVVFGIALIYGEVGRLTGTPGVQFTEIAGAFQSGVVSLVGWLGIGMMLGGLGFKIAAVPFHMWAPDVYEGAPTPSTAFMAVGVKAAAFAGVIRFVAAALLGGQGDRETLVQVFEVLAMITMLVGNLLAIRQTQIKRMLAYSSIAHAGYVLVGVAALVAQPSAQTIQAIAYYLAGYTVMTLGAFGVVLAFERKEDRRLDLAIERFRGTGHRYPALGLAMAVFMFSLTGVPPTAGFFGKLSLFAAAVSAGRTGVVVVAAIASAIGAYYYLSVLVVMFMRATDSEERRVESRWLATGVGACAALTLVVGLLPEAYLGFAGRLLQGWLS